MDYSSYGQFAQRRPARREVDKEKDNTGRVHDQTGGEKNKKMREHQHHRHHHSDNPADDVSSILIILFFLYHTFDDLLQRKIGTNTTVSH